ncbi:glycosyltransferase, partial [Streptomyces sp. NPDC051051]|uniref:glycosyltransferase n=1 Tax=Streptomyces sp. NPDC051051 TaxID=3155666 RepID=UPI00341AEE0D
MIFILTGERLIDADEDLAYESRRPYSGLGRKVDRLSSLIDKSVHDIAQSMPDDLSKSYARAMGMLIDDGGKNYLREFAGQLDKIAEGRRKTSMDIMESKWQVIAEVIRLLIEIAIYLAMSFFTGGATASQIMMAKLRSRFMILTTLSHLLQRLHLAPSLTEAFQEAFMTFAVRLAMMNFAPDGRRPDRFDWNDILKSAAFGAAAGFLTSVFDDFARKIVKGYDNNFLKNESDLGFKNNPNFHHTPKPEFKNNGPGPRPNPDPTPTPKGPGDRPDPTPYGNGPTPGNNTPVTFRNDPLSFRNNTDLWRNNQILRHNADRPGALAGHYGLKGTADFVAAGAGEALAEILIKGAFDGDWSTNWTTFVGAGLSSQVEATLSDTAVNSGAELRHAIDKLRNQPPPTVSGGGGDADHARDTGDTSRSGGADGPSSPDTTGGGTVPTLSTGPASGTGPGGVTGSQSPPHVGENPPSPVGGNSPTHVGENPASYPSPYSPGTLPVTAAENRLWQQVHNGPAEVREQALRDLAALRGSQAPGSTEIGVRDGLHGNLSQRPEVRVVPAGNGPAAESDAEAVRRALDGFGTPVTVNAPVTPATVNAQATPVTVDTPATVDAPVTTSSGTFGDGPTSTTDSPAVDADHGTDSRTGDTSERQDAAFNVPNATDVADVPDATEAPSGPGASATPDTGIGTNTGTNTGVRTGGAPHPGGSPATTASPGPSPQNTGGRGATATPDGVQTTTDDSTTDDSTPVSQPPQTTTSPETTSSAPVVDPSDGTVTSHTDDNSLIPAPDTTTVDPPRVITTSSQAGTDPGTNTVTGDVDLRSDAEADPTQAPPLTVLVSQTPPPTESSPEATALLDGAGTDHAVVLGPAVTPDTGVRPVRTAVELTREGPGTPVRVRPLTSVPDGTADTGFPGSDVLLPLADALGPGPAPQSPPATRSTGTADADVTAPPPKVLTETTGPVHGADPTRTNAPETPGTPRGERGEHVEEAFGLSTMSGAGTAVDTGPPPGPVRQDATLAPETEDRTAVPPRRRVLVVCDESGLGLGGVPVFNMELVKGLHHDHDVTLLTVDNHADYDPEKMREQHGGAKIINASVPGVDEGRDRLDVLAKGSPDQYGLPGEDDAFDIVIGHSRFSGPAAQQIRDSWYPGARVVHFLHTSPVRLDRIKHQPEKGAKKATTERRLMQKADMVAGVGPLLAQEAERLSEEVLRIPALHGFVPGTEIGTPVEPSLLNKTKYLLHLPRKLKLLLPGRATDEIKGVEAAVQAVGMLRRPRSQGGFGLDVRLTIRGGPHPEKNPEEHARWTSIIEAHGGGGITMLPFSTNPADLDNDRETTHALIMPSLHEGFGLVATEAAGRSIPILVNGESGAAEFLKTVTEHGAGMTVEAPFTIDPDTGGEVEGGTEARAQAWASAIAALRGKLPAARGEADQLYDTLKSFTWRHAAQALVEATMATADPVPDRAHPERHPYRGAVTQQGPDGSVEKLKDRSDWQPHDFWDGSTPKPTTGLWTQAEQLARLSELAGVLDLSGAPASARPSTAPRLLRSQSDLGLTTESAPRYSGPAPDPSRTVTESATDLRLESGDRDSEATGDHVSVSVTGDADGFAQNVGQGPGDADGLGQNAVHDGGDGLGHGGGRGLGHGGGRGPGDGGTSPPPPPISPDDPTTAPDTAASDTTSSPSSARIIVRPAVDGTADEPVITTLDGLTVPLSQLRRWVPDTAVRPRPGQAVQTLTVSQSPAEDGTAHSAARRTLLGQDTFRGVRIISPAPTTPTTTTPTTTPAAPDATSTTPPASPASLIAPDPAGTGTGVPPVRRAVFTGPPAPLPGSGTERGADYFVAHATSRTVTLGTEDAAHPTVKVSGVQFGEVLKFWAQDGDKDRPLVLFSCETGQQPEVAGLPVAQHAANRTGRSLYAPTTEVGTARDGQGNVRAVLTEGKDGPGRWRLFTPEPSGADLDELARVVGLHSGPEPADGFARTRTLQQIRTLRDALGPDAEQRPENHELLAGLAFVDGLRWHSPDTAARYGDGRMTPDLLRRMVVDRRAVTTGADVGPAAAGPTAGQDADPTVEEYTAFLRAAADLRATAGPRTTLDVLLPPPPPELPPTTLVSPEDVRGLSYAPSAQVTWSLSTAPLPLSELALSPEDTAELARRKPDLAPAPSRPATLAEDMTLLSKERAGAGPSDLVHADGRAFRQLVTPGGGNCLFRAVLDSARSRDVPPAWAALNIAGLRALVRNRVTGTELGAVADDLVPDPVFSVVDDLRMRALAGVRNPVARFWITNEWNDIAQAVVADGDVNQWQHILRNSGYPELARVAPTPAEARRLGGRGLLAAVAERPGLWATPFSDLLPDVLAHTLDLDLRIVRPHPTVAGDVLVTELHPGGGAGTLHLAYNGTDHYDALVPDTAPITTEPAPATVSAPTSTTAPDPITTEPAPTSTTAPDPTTTPAPATKDADGPGTEAPDRGDPVPLETQLDRYRPARVLTGPDAAEPGPAPRTVTFEDGSRLPAVLISPDADPSGSPAADPGDGSRSGRTDGSGRTPRSGLLTGPGVLTLRSPEEVARQILGQLPEKLRDQFAEAELLRLLTDQPGAFTAPRGARLVGREKSGVGHEMTVEAVPYHRWERFSDVNGATVKLDTMRRGQAGTGGGRSVGFGRRIAAAVSMGPPLSWLVKIGVSLGWTRRTDYTQGTQAYDQNEYRAVDGSHLHLDDVHYRVRVERVTEAPEAGDRETPSGSPAPGPRWQRDQVHTAQFAVRDGLSWRLPDDLTVAFKGPRRAPRTLTFPDGVEPRATTIAGLHLVDPPEDLAIAVSGARPGSSAHRTLVSYVRPTRLLALFGRLTGPVSGPELTRGSGRHPLGHLIVERSIPHRATLVTESVKAEIRDLTQTTYQNQRGHVRDTRFGIQVTAGPNHTFVGPETDVRLQGGPMVRADFSTGRGHYLGTDAARKTTGRVRNHPVALYRVERTLMVRKAGEPASAARPVRVVSLDWMSTRDARRLAGWDDRTPGQTGPHPDAEPPVPWYLTREDPVHLSGQVRAEGFLPDRPQPLAPTVQDQTPATGPDLTPVAEQGRSPEPSRSRTPATDPSEGETPAADQDQNGADRQSTTPQPATPQGEQDRQSTTPQDRRPTTPQDPMRVFADAVIDTLHHSYPSLFVPPLMLRHPRLAKFWYGDGRMRTALHNDRQVREALNHPTLAQSLDDLTTTGVPVTLTEDGKLRRGHHTLILRARLTDRRFETTLTERSLRNAVIGTEVSGQGQQASSTLSGGAELGIAPRDHDKVPGVDVPRQAGNVAVGARYAHTEQKATRAAVAVTHDQLTYHDGADLYSYRVELSASFEGHHRPRGWARLLTVGVLGAGYFVSKKQERPLFDRGTEPVGRVELAVPAAHASERHPPADPAPGGTAPAPATTTSTPGPRPSAAEADGLLDGTSPLPGRDSADQRLTERLLSAPHVVLSVEGGQQRQQLVQATADEAAGETWHVSAPGAPARTALRRAMANLGIAGQLGQYLGPFGSRITGLNGAGPFRTHYLKAAIRGELQNLRVKSDPKPSSFEATVGNEHRIAGTESTGSRTTVGLQGADMPLQRADGAQAMIGSYAAGLQYSWGTGRSTAKTLTPGRNTTLTFAGRAYLVVADAVETVAVRDRWTAVMGMAGTRAAARISSTVGRLSDHLARGLAPRRAAAAVQRIRDAVMFHLPMQDAIEAGLAPDGIATTTPDNLGGGYRVPPFLKGRHFPGHPSGRLDAGRAAPPLMRQLEEIGVSSHDREQVLQRLSPDFLRANLHELTTDGMTLPVRYRTWTSPTHLPVGGSPAQVRFKLTPVTTTVERLRTGFELEDYRTVARDDADSASQDRGVDATAGVGQRTTQSGVLMANPSLQGTAAKQESSTRTETVGRTAMPNMITAQTHVEIVTSYTLTVTMTDAVGDPLAPRATADVGSLREIVPTNLLTPDGDGADGALTEGDVSEPERAVRLLTKDQSLPERIADWRASAASGPSGPSGRADASDVLPFDDLIGSGILAVDIRGTANVHDALTLATARADGVGDKDLGTRYTGDRLAEAVRKARRTPLTVLGTVPAQAQQEATTQTGLAAAFRDALSANGSPLPVQASARLLGQFHTADSRLYAKMHRRGARLLAVENKPRMEAMQRTKTSDALESGTTDTVEGTVGTAPLVSTGRAGIVNPGVTIPIGGAADGTVTKASADTTLGTHLKVGTDRSMLFALPVSWLSVAEVDHRLTDSRPLHALGKARRGPRAAEAETTALVWLREDIARDYGLLDDTTFPDEVGKAWDAQTKAADDLTTAEQRYYDARARAREAWLDLGTEERAALGDGHSDLSTVLPRELAESPAVVAWQAAREEVRRWQERTDAAAADHHRLHLAASRLTAHHQGPSAGPVPGPSQEYARPGWRSEAPEPYTITDGTDSAPRTLTSPDGATVREVHDMPHDGASFFHALIAAADARGRLSHLLGTDLADRFTQAPGDPAVTAEAVDAARDRLTWALGDDGNEDLLDALALDVADTFTQDELDAAGVTFTPEQQAEFDAFGRLPLTFWPTTEQRIELAKAALSRPFAPEPRQDDTELPDGEPAPPVRRAGDHGGADLLPALAARVLGTPLTVVTGEGREQVFLPYGTDPAAVDPVGDPVLFAADGFFHAALPPGTPAPVATPLPTPASEADPGTSTVPATDGTPATQQPPAHRSHTTPPWMPPADSSGPRYRLARDGVLTAPDGATYTQGTPTGRGNGFFGALATALRDAAERPGPHGPEVARLRNLAAAPPARLMRLNGLPGSPAERGSLFRPPPMNVGPGTPEPGTDARDGHLRRHLAEAPWGPEADRAVAEWAAAATGTTVTLIEENGAAHTYPGPAGDNGPHIRLRRRGGDVVPLTLRTPAPEPSRPETPGTSSTPGTQTTPSVDATAVDAPVVDEAPVDASVADTTPVDATAADVPAANTAAETATPMDASAIDSPPADTDPSVPPAAQPFAPTPPSPPLRSLPSHQDAADIPLPPSPVSQTADTSPELPAEEEEAHELSTLSGAGEGSNTPTNSDVVPVPPGPVLRPFKLGNFEFTNLNQTDRYV